MSHYIITTKEDLIEITDQEFKNLANKSGLVFIPSVEEYININFIYRILTEGSLIQYKKNLKAKMMSGRLHDGTKVIKKFGMWVSLRNPDAVISVNHYPEIAKDDIYTEEEWEEKLKIKKLKE